VREVEVGPSAQWGEAGGKLVHAVGTPDEAVDYLRKTLP